MDSRLDYSQIKAQENPQMFPAGNRVSMKEEDLRYIYGLLMAEAPIVTGDKNLSQQVADEIQRAFEMTRHGVEVSGKVISDGPTFRDTCESTVGVDPLDTGLEERIVSVYAKIDSVLMGLMKLRREVPERALKRYAKNLDPPASAPPQPEEIKTEATDVSAAVKECVSSLEELPELEKRFETIKRKISALENY